VLHVAAAAQDEVALAGRHVEPEHQAFHGQETDRHLLGVCGDLAVEIRHRKGGRVHQGGEEEGQEHAEAEQPVAVPARLIKLVGAQRL